MHSTKESPTRRAMYLFAAYRLFRLCRVYDKNIFRTSHCQRASSVIKSVGPNVGRHGGNITHIHYLVPSGVSISMASDHREWR